jgi:hypothetical protein
MPQLSVEIMAGGWIRPRSVYKYPHFLGIKVPVESNEASKKQEGRNGMIFS